MQKSKSIIIMISVELMISVERLAARHDMTIGMT